jgi:hypothetical protein
VQCMGPNVNMCAKVCKMCATWFCARSPIKRGNSMTEEENGVIVDANFSTPSQSKKSLAVLGDCAWPSASLTSANACAATSALPQIRIWFVVAGPVGQTRWMLDLVAAEECP